MMIPTEKLSFPLILLVLLLGLVRAWDQVSNEELADELRPLLLRKLIERIASHRGHVFTSSGEKRRYVPDIGYGSRGQAGEDVSRKLLALERAHDPFGPGRRK